VINIDPIFLKAEAAEVRAQLRLEADRSVRRELNKTLKHLEKQYRKATRHYHPWQGILRVTIGFVTVTLLVFWGVLELTKRYGVKDVLSTCGIPLIFVVVGTVTFLRIKGHLTQENYRGLITSALSALPQPKLGVLNGEAHARSSLAETRPIHALPEGVKSTPTADFPEQ
jgi:hypothetical protein